MAPMVKRWVSACFPEGSDSSVRKLEEVINEVSDAARDDHDEATANKWAEGYEFPQRYIDSDVACLRAAGLNFAKMVKRRLALISAKRLSRERVERTLREDNPERELMLNLAIGMKVHKPAGFVPNGCQPRSPLRAVYCSVASAVNKMLGAVVEQSWLSSSRFNWRRSTCPTCTYAKHTGLRRRGKPRAAHWET